MIPHRLEAGATTHCLLLEIGGSGVSPVPYEKKSRELLRTNRPAGDTRELPGAMAPGSPGEATEWVA